MHVLLRDHNVGKHADYLNRIAARRVSMTRRFQSRIEKDAPSYSEAESFLLSYHRFCPASLRRNETHVRTRLSADWKAWKADGVTPTAQMLIESSMSRGPLSWA